MEASVRISSTGVSSPSSEGVVTRDTTSLTRARSDETPPLKAVVEPLISQAVSEKELSVEQLEKLSAKFESALNQIHGTSIQFGVNLVDENQSVNDLHFRVINKDTGEVVRQFPPGKIVELADRISLDGIAKGIFFDEEV